MKIIQTKTLNTNQKLAIISLWNTEYPKGLVYTSPDQFDQYLGKLSDKNHIMIRDDANNVIGWFMDFERNEARWFAMIISSTQQKKGYGSMLLNQAKNNHKELNGWATDHNNYTKINGAIYYSPLEFYQKNGFKILSDIRFENEVLSSVKIQWKLN